MSHPPPQIESLTASHTLGYNDKRSVGPVMGRFFTALKKRQILGIRRSDGRVLVPPREYDPDSGQDLDEMVEVADTGVELARRYCGSQLPSGSP